MGARTMRIRFWHVVLLLLLLAGVLAWFFWSPILASWRDHRQQDLMVPSATLSGKETIKLLLLPLPADRLLQDSTPQVVRTGVHQASVRFNLRTLLPDQPYPALAIRVFDQTGRRTQGYVLLPTEYPHGDAFNQEVIALTVPFAATDQHLSVSPFYPKV